MTAKEKMWLANAVINWEDRLFVPPSLSTPNPMTKSRFDYGTVTISDGFVQAPSAATKMPVIDARGFGKVLARSKRERWTQQIAQAKLIERPELARDLAKPDAINAITPMQSAALTMQERANVTQSEWQAFPSACVPHLESLPPSEILERARNVEQFDRLSRRNFGLDHQPATGGPLSLALLGTHCAIQINQT